jgi:uncharacterized membrane protein
MPQMSKRWAIVLFSSLALNLFVGGVIVSHWGGHWSARDRDVARSHTFGLRGASRQMGEETRATMRSMWSERANEMRPLWEAMRQARQETIGALGAEPFDKATLEAALAKSLAASVASQEAFHAALVDTASELTPEQRRSFFAAASRRLHRQPGARRK